MMKLAILAIFPTMNRIGGGGLNQMSTLKHSKHSQKSHLLAEAWIDKVIRLLVVSTKARSGARYGESGWLSISPVP